MRMPQQLSTCRRVAEPDYNIPAEDVALTTNQNFVRDFPIAYDILYENISDQVPCLEPVLSPSEETLSAYFEALSTGYGSMCAATCRVLVTSCWKVVPHVFSSPSVRERLACVEHTQNCSVLQGLWSFSRLCKC